VKKKFDITTERPDTKILII